MDRAFRFRLVDFLCVRVLSNLIHKTHLSMKNILFVALAFFVFACGNVENSKEYKDLQAKYDSVVAVSSGKSGENAELSKMIEEIEANLDSVAKDQMVVGELNKEGYANQKEKIDAMIAGINSYMEQNKTKMEALEKKAKKAGKANSALQKMISSLKKQISEKEVQIVEMQSTIQGLEVKVGELNQTVATKEQEIASKNDELSKKDNELVERQKTIDSKETELTTGYFAFGTRKELADLGIIKKEGGVLGMGKVVKISEKLDNKSFKKVNIKSLSEIKLGLVKKKKVVSAHPENSYYFTTSGEEVFLKISDYNKFWSLTKYCVIEID
jgi:predicted  nucleic acid-binding Zn-ribbon protein